VAGRLGGEPLDLLESALGIKAEVAHLPDGTTGPSVGDQ
jgi:hypothetical protein